MLQGVMTDNATRVMLHHFTRDELRDYAKSVGVHCGRNKENTIHNLIVAGKVKAQLSVTIKQEDNQ